MKHKIVWLNVGRVRLQNRSGGSRRKGRAKAVVVYNWEPIRVEIRDGA